jgi:hypothetical protein
MATSTSRNVCFNCNKPGHWASSCPERFCDFCGHTGHTVQYCKVKDQLHVPVPETHEKVSRTRSRATSLPLADIMFNCHLEKGLTAGMEEQLVALAKVVCKRGIDEYQLAEYIFETHRNDFMINDPGHMEVIGFLIKKYISAENPYLKTFLKELEKELPQEFDGICKFKFGLVVVRRSNGTTCFRKGHWAI